MKPEHVAALIAAFGVAWAGMHLLLAFLAPRRRRPT